MKLHTPLSAFLFISFICCSNALADNYIAFLQYSNPDGLNLFVFQMDVPNKRECHALNENHWIGAKTTCPNCKIKDSGCLSKLPGSYVGIANNSPIIFPYLSWQKDRIVFLGIPMPNAVQICKNMTREYQNKLNRQAICVLPN